MFKLLAVCVLTIICVGNITCQKKDCLTCPGTRIDTTADESVVSSNGCPEGQVSISSGECVPITRRRGKLRSLVAYLIDKYLPGAPNPFTPENGVLDTYKDPDLGCPPGTARDATSGQCVANARRQKAAVDRPIPHRRDADLSKAGCPPDMEEDATTGESGVIARRRANVDGCRDGHELNDKGECVLMSGRRGLIRNLLHMVENAISRKPGIFH